MLRRCRLQACGPLEHNQDGVIPYHFGRRGAGTGAHTPGFEARTPWPVETTMTASTEQSSIDLTKGIKHSPSFSRNVMRECLASTSVVEFIVSQVCQPTETSRAKGGAGRAGGSLALIDYLDKKRGRDFLPVCIFRGHESREIGSRRRCGNARGSRQGRREAEVTRSRHSFAYYEKMSRRKDDVWQEMESVYFLEQEFVCPSELVSGQAGCVFRITRF